MKRFCLTLALAVMCGLPVHRPAEAQTCSIGGHNETSENFAPGGWSTINMSPGTRPARPGLASRDQRGRPARREHRRRI